MPSFFLSLSLPVPHYSPPFLHTCRRRIRLILWEHFNGSNCVRTVFVLAFRSLARIHQTSFKTSELFHVWCIETSTDFNSADESASAMWELDCTHLYACHMNIPSHLTFSLPATSPEFYEYYMHTVNRKHFQFTGHWLEGCNCLFSHHLYEAPTFTISCL